MKKPLLFLVFIFSLIASTKGQQTVGLFQNDSLSSDGYTLFSPSLATTTYLIDNCGRLVHTWQHNNAPGLATYFLENGTLLRAGRIPSSFNGGGTGGRLEIYDWNGFVLWSYDYSSLTYHQHHDIAALPNGNILVLAWELVSDSVAIAAGKDPNSLLYELWPEHIVELEPIGVDSANIVWEWHVMDHVIQDYDSTKNNFGVVADHPELIDLNYTSAQFGNPDWLHANAIDYNPDLDQILISSRNLNEFFIIDHSTTTAEAASHSGGNSGKGGDILYRWGNPATYDRGTFVDQKLFAQHDAHWIDAGLPDEGKIMVFNNGIGRSAGNYSSVDIIDPPIDTAGNYTVPVTGAFAPTSPSWYYQATNPTDFFSSYISGAQKMPNGNVLICEGAKGHFFEVDSNGNKHWDYVNPVASSGPITQGGNPIFNDVFRAYRYPANYSGFNGLTLVPGSPIELNPLISNCLIFTGIESNSLEQSTNIYYDIINRHLIVKNLLDEPIELFYFDISGKLLNSFSINALHEVKFPHNLAAGVYICKIVDSRKRLLNVKKIIQPN